MGIQAVQYTCWPKLLLVLFGKDVRLNGRTYASDTLLGIM
jgi:hypothetical protein